MRSSTDSEMIFVISSIFGFSLRQPLRLDHDIAVGNDETLGSEILETAFGAWALRQRPSRQIACRSPTYDVSIASPLVVKQMVFGLCVPLVRSEMKSLSSNRSSHLKSRDADTGCPCSSENMQPT